jgi:proteasome accessory factor B
MTSSKGRWYVIGRDVDRDATRMFKLSRITDLPRRESKPGAYEVPADIDLRSLARALAPREPTEEAVLALRTGRAPGLRRRGRSSSTDLALPQGFDVHVVAFSDLRSAAEEICRYGADVVVLEPAELRERVVQGLVAVARTARVPASGAA